MVSPDESRCHGALQSPTMCISILVRVTVVRMTTTTHAPNDGKQSRLVVKRSSLARHAPKRVTSAALVASPYRFTGLRCCRSRMAMRGFFRAVCASGDEPFRHVRFACKAVAARTFHGQACGSGCQQ